MPRRAIIDVDSKRPRKPVPDAVVRPQRNKRFLAVLLMGLFTTWLGLTVALDAFGLLLGALFAVPFAGLALWQFLRTPAGGRRVEVGPEGLFCEGKLIVLRDEIARVLWMIEPSGVVVSIGLKQGFYVAVEMPNREAAEELVSALGGSAKQRTAEFLADGRAARLGLPLAAGWTALLFGAAIFLLSRGDPLGFGLAGLWYGGALLWSLPTKINIGTDGVRLSWLGRARTVRFADLARIERKGDELSLVRHDGTRVSVLARWVQRLRATAQPEYASSSAYLDALTARIEEAWAAARGGATVQLRRQDQPVGLWIRSLRSLVERGASGFRDAPALPAALWRAVEDGHAEPSARAAAAVALGPTLDEAGRARLAAIAEVSVEPRLRVAIEAAARDEVEAMVEAMAALEREGDAALRAEPRVSSKK